MEWKNGQSFRCCFAHSASFTFTVSIIFSVLISKFDVNHAAIEPDEMSVPCVRVCVSSLCKRTSERSRERIMLLNIYYYKHWTIRQFDVDDFSFGRSYFGQVWNHKWNIRLVYFSVWFHEYKNNLPNPWLFKWSCFMLCACMRVRALVFSCCNILNYVRLLLRRLQNFMWAYKVLPILLFFFASNGLLLDNIYMRVEKNTKKDQVTDCETGKSVLNWFSVVWWQIEANHCVL